CWPYRSCSGRSSWSAAPNTSSVSLCLPALEMRPRNRRRAEPPEVKGTSRRLTPGTQTLERLDVRSIRALVLVSRDLENERYIRELGTCHQPREGRFAKLALANVVVAIDVRAERALRIVGVHAAKSVESDILVELRDDPSDAVLFVDGVASREDVAGIEAD